MGLLKRGQAFFLISGIRSTTIFPFFLRALPLVETQPTPPYVSLRIKRTVRKQSLHHLGMTTGMWVSSIHWRHRSPQRLPRWRHVSINRKKLPEEIFAKHITKQTPAIMSMQQPYSLRSRIQEHARLLHRASSKTAGAALCSLQLVPWKIKPQTIFICQFFVQWIVQVTFNLNIMW